MPFLALLWLVLARAADDISYHNGVPIAILEFDRTPVQLVEGQISHVRRHRDPQSPGGGGVRPYHFAPMQSIPVRINLARKIYLQTVVAGGAPADGLSFPDGTPLFSEESQVVHFRIAARVQGSYSVALRLQPMPGQGQVAFREVQLSVLVRPPGHVTMSPSAFDPVFAGSRSRRYTVTVPAVPMDLELEPRAAPGKRNLPTWTLWVCTPRSRFPWQK